MITKDAPQYRLVSDKLWAEANAISDQSAAATWRGADGRLKSRATKSEFLLSPFLACVCGGSMHAKQSGKGDKKRWLYTCTTHHLRGSKACPNGKGIRVDWADAAIRKIEQALKEQKARAKDPAPLKAEAEKLRKEMRPGDRCQTEGFTSASCRA